HHQGSSPLKGKIQGNVSVAINDNQTTLISLQSWIHNVKERGTKKFRPPHCCGLSQLAIPRMSPKRLVAASVREYLGKAAGTRKAFFAEK
ncbi:hypothetical protein ACMA5I_14080, partial [Paracoccaceae bacterium GXU_MW_L88]